MSPRIRLLLPCPPPVPGRVWGDFYFARSLSAALQAQGCGVEFEFHQVLTRKERRWRIPTRRRLSREIDLVIRGKQPYRPLGFRPFYMWLISQTDTVTDDELRQVRHVFVASKPYAEKLQAKGISASFLPQCTDPAIFQPKPADPDCRTHLLFVGNRRNYAARPVVQMALDSGEDLAVWGRGWNDDLPAGVLRGDMIDNTDLGRHYRSADVVLNDHTSDMLKDGFVSNRVYDVLACGRPLLTEDMPGIPEDIRPHLYLYRDGDFADVLKRAIGECDRDRSQVAAHVLRTHTFDQRAKVILDKIRRR
ncbi:glycosyltransferase family protein [Actibacterium ureilyticum]|uniref:glycosyltransferase family protein n=1 Tax=Actibacterium ureilyticum TaxID=1590614 RepID=UPI000BAABFFC|nr:glycosyltransferase [Actibacterium ureilyticum]